MAERPGELVAFALLRSGKSTPYVTDPTALEVQRFYVDRSCHGTGLAQTLMASCIEEAARRGARTLWLGVWERNPRAIRFYKAQGFVEIGTQIFVVGSDPQQDVVLSRPIADRSS